MQDWFPRSISCLRDYTWHKFAADVLSQMRHRGISAPDAVRFFSIFYQLRRAFYFIVRSLIGESACMREFRRHLWQNVFTQEVQRYERYLWNRMEDFSTLLLGETGTGKGTAAAAIGRSGYIPFDEKLGRFAESFMRSFVSLNLSTPLPVSGVSCDPTPPFRSEAKISGNRVNQFAP